MRTKWIAAIVAAVVAGSARSCSCSGRPAARRTDADRVRSYRKCSAVFVLRGASGTPGRTPDQAGGQQLPEDYLLVSIPPAVSLEAHVNHRVAVTGVVSERARAGRAPARTRGEAMRGSR